MSATSPSPSTSTSPPPIPSSPPPQQTPQPNADPPDSSNPTVPLPAPPPPIAISPPPTNPSPPPPSDPPLISPPPPSNPPTTLSPPPPRPSDPPTTPSSPPPPSPSDPPPTPSPPSPSDPPSTPSPPPPSDPPSASPPPPPSTPENSPPPPVVPSRSPPPPIVPSRSPPPPRNSPPPPVSPSRRPPPPPRTPPPRNSPPFPPSLNPTPPPPEDPLSPPSPFVPVLPPSPFVPASPPPPISSVFPPPPPFRVPIAPTSNDTSGGLITNGNAGIGVGGVAAIAAVSAILVLSLFGLVFWCVTKRRRKNSGPGGHVMPMGTSSNYDAASLKAHSTVPLIGSGSSNTDFVDSPSDTGGIGNSRPYFAFEELAQATNRFSALNLLGEGGFGSVYKGVLPDGLEIAVKQLKIGGGQGEREFKAEVEIISRVHHRHLVSLVGYCISDSRRLLVYNYVPNNNLYYHLHEEGRVMEWSVRVKVAGGAARGIAYLHEDCHPRIIHRDIKSSNILLDNNFEARVSDFGLAKLALNDADTHITTRVMGTFGYVAPEYASSGKLTDKSDVYSYGVVLLELITGRKPVDPSQPLGDESLVEWARPLLNNAIESGQFGSFIDSRLEKNFVETEMLRMIEIAAACVRHSSAKRPRMKQVVRAFDGLGASDITNGMRVGASEEFNSAQQSEEIRWFRRMAFGSQDYSTDFFSQGSHNTRENSKARE